MGIELKLVVFFAILAYVLFKTAKATANAHAIFESKTIFRNRLEDFLMFSNAIIMMATFLGFIVSIFAMLWYAFKWAIA